MSASTPPTRPSRTTRTNLVFAVLLLCFFLAAQGIYACWLNHLFYQRFAPFNDSAAYTNQLAMVIWQARTEGWQAALGEHYFQGTVVFPWLIAVLLSPWMEPSRLFGVWSQEFFLLLLGGSLLVYLIRFRHASVWGALCWTVPFLSFHAVYFYNGGISDFRMDLTLYMLLGLTGVWYLTTYETSSLRPWILMTASALLCLLNRATAPAYLAAMFAPPLAVRFVFSQSPERRALAHRVLLTVVPGLALGTLYLLSKWEYLHYYYFIWGPDPTARLPLHQSAAHFLTAVGNLGGWLLVAGAAQCAAILFSAWNLSQPFASARRLWLRLDGKLLWIGTAPPLLLTLTGAGLNPFVSMPAVFGWLLFLLLPLKGPSPSGKTVRLCCVLLLAAAFWNAARGVRWHTDPPNHHAAMSAFRQAITWMRDDTLRRGAREVRFATSHVSMFEAWMLRNVLFYEFGGKPKQGGVETPDGIVYRMDLHGALSASAPVNWRQDIPGASDEEKFRWILENVCEKVDYLLLPDDASIAYLERVESYNFINTKVREIKRRLLDTGQWQLVGPRLAARPVEVIEIYRKVAKAP